MKQRKTVNIADGLVDEDEYLESQRHLISRLIMGISMVTIWVKRVTNYLSIPLTLHVAVGYLLGCGRSRVLALPLAEAAFHNRPEFRL